MYGLSGESSKKFRSPAGSPVCHAPDAGGSCLALSSFVDVIFGTYSPALFKRLQEEQWSRPSQFLRKSIYPPLEKIIIFDSIGTIDNQSEVSEGLF
jgi:hypothetical protein